MNAEEQVFWPKPGEVLVIPPGVVHFLRIRNREKPYRRIVLWISASYLEGLLLRSEDYGYLFQRARLKNSICISSIRSLPISCRAWRSG